MGAAFQLSVAAIADNVIAAWGQPVIYRRDNSADLNILAVPDDPSPEDAVTGQYTVRVVRVADIPGGPRKGDNIVIGAIVYDVFNIRILESDPLARLFISKKQ